jgi:RNA polymerase sigma-70 factor (ECF subfamily)
MERSAEFDGLIRRAQAGDLDAFEKIIRLHEGSLRAWTVAHCPPGGDSDDVAQRTFIEIYRNIRDFKPGTNFGAWLFSVARFQMLAETTRLRRLADYHQRYAPLALIDALARRAETGENADRKIQLLKSCLQALEASPRTLLAQRYDEGLPLDEIARRADRSVGAIKKALFILRSKLSDCVRSKLATEAT